MTAPRIRRWSDANRPRIFRLILETPKWRVEGVVLEFAHTRGRMNRTRIKVSGVPRINTNACHGRCVWIRFRVDKPIQRNSRITIEVPYRGERLELLRYKFVRCVEEEEFSKRTNDVVDDRSALTAKQAKQTIDHAPLPKSAFTRHQRAIEEDAPHAGTKKTAFRRFFFALDAPFHEELAEFVVRNKKKRERILKDVKKVTRKLIDRFMQRAEFASRGTGSRPMPLRVTDAIERLAGIFESVVRDHGFVRSDGSLDSDRFREAFERFARGDLGFPDSESDPNFGVPDSAQFFCFAEFAIGMAKASSVSGGLWEQMAGIMVHAAKIYRDCAATGPRSRGHYGRPRPVQGLNLAAITQGYSISTLMGVEDSFNRLCGDAFYDDFPPSQRSRRNGEARDAGS